MMQRKKSSYGGLQKGIKKIKLPALEAWENEYPGKKYVVRLKTNEFTCICPKTRLPDFATIYVEYIPRKYCVELKSFKNYLVGYRGIGIFHEHVINRILDDFVKAVKPGWIKIKGRFNMRGGIRTVVEVEHGRFPL